MDKADPTSLRLAHVTLADGRTADIEVAGDRIAAIRSPAAGSGPGDAKTIDCRGLLALPSLVDGHIHLDKTLLGTPFVPHRPGRSVRERVAAEKAVKRDYGGSVERSGGLLIEQAAAFGTGAMRSHVDVDTEAGLANLHAVVALKERYRHLVDLQIVAFPQSGILSDPGTADLLDAALREGADLVGGLDPISFDDDLDGHLDCVFGLAERHGAGIDIHLHDGGTAGARQLLAIAERTRAAGLEHRVAVSHAFALGDLGEAELGRTAAKLAEAGIAIMTNGPGTAPMPPVLALRDAGVAVFAGSDNIRDGWSPYGNGDMLERAMMIGYRQGLMRQDEIEHCLAMASSIAAAVLGREGYGLRHGAPADLILVPSASVAEAVLDRPRARTVFKRGRMVAKDGRLIAAKTA